MKITAPFTILLDSSYNSATSPKFEADLFQLVESMQPELTDNTVLTLDAEKLGYISSAGLRVILKLKKHHSELKIINVSPEVYSIFEVTGFNSMVKIRRAIREIDLTGAVEIGHGLSSHVYRLNDDFVAKIYVSRIPLWKVERESDNAKKAFMEGIPCVISYELVKHEDSYGLVFEYLKSRGVSRILNADPSKFDEYADKYIALLQNIHSIEVDDSYEEIKPLWHKWSDMLADFFTKEELEKLHAVISAVPDRNTFIHSDAHVNNILEQDGQLEFVDMADIGRGHPVFDIGPVLFHYHYMEIANPQLCESAVVLEKEMRSKMYTALLERYLYDPDPERHAALEEIYDAFGAIRCGLIAAKHAQLDYEEKKPFVETMKKHFFYRADRILELIQKYL